ncbi:TPA: LPXTG cell wall anchor domain-containing protein [Bacillus cereus]|nr:LPXTG cell wall anchor domain-containing protein [Bacillus cereus]HDR4631876.1 LPXTG cell wall anchor domain-containing protein [Bacillus cereus]
MKKLFNICLIVFVLFSQFISFPYNQAKAETLKETSLFDTVEMKDATDHIIDEAKNPNNLIKIGSTIQVEYAWSIKDQQVVHANDTAVIQIPLALKVSKDLQGDLVTDQKNIGQYFITAKDNKLKLIFNDQVENSKDAKGKIKIDTVFNPTLKTEEKSVQIAFPLGTLVQPITVPIQVEDSKEDGTKQDTNKQMPGQVAKPATDNPEQNPATKPATDNPEQNPATKPATDNPEQNSATKPATDNPEQNPATKPATDNPEQNPATKPAADNPEQNLASDPAESTNSGPKQITTNILTGVKLTDKDGKPFTEDNRPSTDSPANIEFTWELLKSMNVKSGDYYIFDLPKHFKIYNTINSPLYDSENNPIGNFTVTKDGKVTMTFNDYVEEHPDVVGNLQLKTEFNKAEIKGTTTQEIPFPIKDKDVSITVDFKPNIQTTTNKKGLPDRPINTNEINWSVEMNKTKDTLKNTVFKDNIPQGTSLNKDSIKVYYLEVDVNGNATRGKEADPADYKIISSDGSKLEIAFKDSIKKAYQIEYVTKITDENVKNFQNNVTITSDNQGQQKASSTVTVSRGTHLNKTSKYDPKTQTIEWTITYNGDQRNIKKTDALLKDIFDDTHELDVNSIVVKNASYDDKGRLVTGDAVNNYTVSNKKNGFDLQFNEDINSAYVITYKTKPTNNVIKDGKIKNIVTADNGSSKENEAGFQQQNIIKSNNKAETNYKDKTTTWTITVNNNNYSLNNAIITDTFDHGGLQLKDKKLEIKDGDYTLQAGTDYVLDVTDKGFKITLIGTYQSNMTKTLVVKYTTDFDYTKLESGKTSFKNTGNLSWIDTDSNPQSNKVEANFDPDNFTKANGYKYGSYNAQTKEITWVIGFNYNNVEIKDPYVIDVIQDKQKLVPGSIEVRDMILNGSPDNAQPGNAVPTEKYELEEPTEKNKNTLKVHFKQSINSPYYIIFKTSLDGELIQGTYKNEAELKDGSKIVNTLKGDAQVKKGGSFVTKKAVQDDNYINWSIAINESQSTIADAVVTDDPTDNQVLVEDSFHLYPTTVDYYGNVTKDTANELKQGTDYKLKITTDNNTGKQHFEIAFLKKIDRAYILEYRSLINADDKEKVSNKAKIAGNQLTVKNTETTETIEVRMSSGSGGGSATKGRGNLEIIKVDNDNKNTLLTGAEFTLYDRTGKTVIRKITTDKDGIAKFNNLKRDKYLLKETKAPEGYVISWDLKQGKIVELGTQETTTYKLANKKFVGKVVLTKSDDLNKNVTLQGAVFTLLDKDKKIISEHEKLTTNNKGQITVEHLKPGTYYLKETTAPEHYKLDDRLIEVKIAEDQTTVINRTATNSLIPGSAILTKVDKDGKTLAGAEFSVRDRKNKIIPGYGKLTTNDQGQIEAKDLRPGDYQFVEEKAPKDYDIDKTPIEFTIVKSQKKAVTVTATNHLIKGGVTLTKTDDIDGTALAGAIFKIVDANDEKKVIRENVKTGADGKVTVKDLEPGTYKFIETEAPKDYVLNTKPIEFTIDKSQQSFATVTAKNSLTKGGIELTKVNAADEKETLEGAVFKIVNRDTNEDARTNLVTNSEGKLVVDDLRPGNYKLIETKAPTYYDVNVEPIEFTIEKGQQTLLPLTFKNSLTKGKVKLIKEDDVESSIALAGAVFTLQDANGTEIAKDLKTDEHGVLVIPDLAPGDYQFIETAAPEHYKLDQTPIKFTIKKGSKDDLPVPVTVKNSLLTGGVTLTKVDDVDGTTLEGAEFIIVDAHDTKKVVRKGLTTDEHGKVSASDLRPGDYQFIEVKAPKDYTLGNNPIPFTIGKSQKENITVTATNSLKKGAVTLTKIDDIDRTMLKGAVFKIVDMKGTEVRTNLVTDKNGKIYVPDLRPGDYQFIETKTPEHYVLDETPIPFTIERSQTKEINVTGKNTLKKGSVELTKIDDIDTDTKLANAVFNLLDADGEIVEEGLKTNAEGKIVVENLRPGTYQFVETIAPEHYDLNKTPIEFTIKKSQTETLHVTAKNALTKGAVELSKVDDIDGTKLEGAVFNIVDMNGTVIHKNLVTNSKGKIEIDDLRPGDYQFIETKAPKHYVLDETPIDFTIEKGQKKTISLTAKNSLQQGSIELLKVDDLNDQMKLSDAVFNLLDQNGKVIKTDLKTNNEGKIVVENLRPGTYQFVETTAPKHYDLDKKPIVVTVEKSQKDIATVTMKNSLTKGGVELSKVDSVDGTTLEGAVFNIVDMNGTVIRKSLTTNSQGKISVPDLRPGDYQFIETKAPKHYDLNKEPIPFTIEKGQAEPISVTAKNSLTKGAVELSKVDDIDGTALEGAIFKIVDMNGHDVRTGITTDAKGKVSISDLHPGDYQFIETTAPKHYKLDATPIKFTIEKSQAEKLQVTAKNSLIEGAVELIKVDDINPDTKLSDAVFNIIDAKGKVVRTNLTTDKDGKISASNLRPGDYQFVETKAPKDYDLNETPIPFTIEKSQSTHVSVTAKNGLTKGGVELTKIDSLDTKETLEGAVFKITDLNGNDIRTNLVTNKDGKIIAKDLQPGDYQFIETKAPKHYDLNETPIKFTIERSQTKHVFVTATNSLTKGSVELIKVDDVEENTTLEGAVFKIVNKDGHDVRTDLTTDKNGRLVVDELPPGNYEFIETKAPTHYDLNETPIKFTVKKGQEKIASVTATNSLTKGAVELSKVDDIDGSALKDAVFKIVDMNGNDVRTDLTTDKDGKISVSDLRPGNYQFIETKAPKHYDLNQNPINFTVEKSQTATASVTATNSLTKGAVELTKVDDIDGTTLEGAIFKIVDSNGHDVRTDLTTNKDGKISVSDLRPGDYQFIETKAPKHYDLNQNPINFTVEKSQTATASVTATNSLTKGAVELTKVDDIDGTTLEGAIFKIVDSNGHDVRTDLTTNKDGKISVSDLRPGDYQFIETKAPTGYDLNAKPIPFTITKGQSQVTSVTALNSLTTGSMELTKVDIDHNGTLEGAIFNILDQDGKVVREGLKTDGHGKLIVNDLKPGNYQLVETKAPEGYQLDASLISFTIEKAQASPLQITVSNKKVESSSGGDNKPITPPNKEEKPGKETSEELENGNPETQTNKQQDDRNTGKELPNTGHKNDSTQTVGIILLLAGLLSVLATKRKKYY